MVNCVITAAVTPRGTFVFVGYVQVCATAYGFKSKVLNPLEKDPFCSFGHCNPGLILKLNEYKILHFMIQMI